MRAAEADVAVVRNARFRRYRGSWTIFREAKRLYSRLGYSERIDLLEADEEHGFPTAAQQSVRRMRRWLMGKDDAVQEPDMASLPTGEMIVTPRGQVQLLGDVRSVMDLNLEVAAAAEPTRRDLWLPANRDVALDAVRRAIGASRPAELPAASVEPVGRIEREGLRN